PIASPSHISAYLMGVSAERLTRLARVLATVRRRMGAAAREAAASLPEQGRGAVAESEMLHTVVSAASNRDAVATQLRVRHSPISHTTAPIVVATLLILSVLLAWWRGSFANPKLAQRLPLAAASVTLHDTGGLVATRALPAPSSVEVMTEQLNPHDGVQGTVQDAGTAVGLAQPPRGLSDRRPKATSNPFRPTGAAKARPSNAMVLPAASACDPPTYVDAGGIRHFKAGCL
ncbi:MAG TPA: hypothetical protein VIV60_16250, partial [Polyangiaceae bacterium]